MIKNAFRFERQGLRIVGAPPNHDSVSPVYFPIPNNVIVAVLFAGLKPTVAKKPRRGLCRDINQHPFALQTIRRNAVFLPVMQQTSIQGDTVRNQPFYWYARSSHRFPELNL